jgi:hypothetical protein
MSRKTEDVIDRAVELIEPPASRRDACAKEIAVCIEVCRNARKHRLPSPAKTKRLLNRFAGAARRAIDTAKEVPESYQWHVFPEPGRPMRDGKPIHGRMDELLTQLKWASYRAANFSACLVTSNDKRDVAALSAANLARSVLREFNRRVTHYKDGRYYQLASLIYEGATGKRGRDLSRCCRDPDRPLGHRLLGRSK